METVELQSSKHLLPVRCMLRSLLMMLFLMTINHVRSLPTLTSLTSVRKNVICRFLTTNILIVGKKNGGEQFIDEGCALYEKRLKPVMTLNTVFLKSDEALVEAALSSKGKVMALDETGKEFTSREFSEVVFKGLEEGGAHLTFVVGGAFGLPDAIKSKFPLISLSRMTWTHQMARLLLIEQIYRAAEIHKGSGYHKD